MTRWFLLPGQNYAGPGNPIDARYLREHPPTNDLDRAALAHDRAYQAYLNQGKSPYFHWNKADQQLLDDLQGNTSANALLTRTIFGTKKLGHEAITGMKRFFSDVAAGAEALGDAKRTKHDFKKFGDLLLGSSQLSAQTQYIGSGKKEIMSRIYSGRFNRPNKGRYVDKYALQGYKTQEDISGEKSTTDRALGIGIRSAVPWRLAQAAGAALFRHLLLKHYRIQVTHPDQEVFASYFLDTKADPADNTVDNVAPMVPQDGAGPTAANPNQFLYRGNNNDNQAQGAVMRYKPDTIDTAFPEIFGIAFYAQATGRTSPLGDGETILAPHAAMQPTAQSSKEIYIPGEKDHPDYCFYKFHRGTTLNGFGSWWAHKVLKGFFGSAGDNTVSLKGYQFFHMDYWNPIDDWTANNFKGFIRPQGLISLEETYIKVTSKAYLKIQNRTKGDSGGTTTDSVDANPVRVRLYHHNTTVPVQKDPRQMGTINNKVTLYNLNDNTGTNADADDGIIIARIGNQEVAPAAEANSTLGGPFIHIPDANDFVGVTRSANDIMQPGEIKVHSVYFTYDGKITDFPLGFDEMREADASGFFPTNNLNRFYTNVENTKHMFGTCDMLWFQQILAVGQNNIDVAYEGSRSVWARVKKTRMLTCSTHQKSINYYGTINGIAYNDTYT